MRRALVLFLASLGSAAAAPLATRATDYSNFTMALVRAPPVNIPYPPPSDDWFGQMHDINATVDFGIKLIKRAALEGANFVAFPELWFPGYINTEYQASDFLSNYFNQGITVGDCNWKKLVAAAQDNKVWLEFGFAQLKGDYIYMAQGLIDSTGNVVQVRQKLRPSGGERSIFSDGTIDELVVHQTPFGRLGMLECWEHFHPTMTIPMQAQLENIHIAAFPWAPDFDVDTGVTRSEVSLTAARYYAVTGGAYVFMPAVGTAAVIAPNGTIVTSIQASDDPYSRPLLYHTVNATQWTGNNYTYDWNEFSWSAVQQIVAAYPSYIPKTSSHYIDHRQNSITTMRNTGPIPLDYEFQF